MGLPQMVEVARIPAVVANDERLGGIVAGLELEAGQTPAGVDALADGERLAYGVEDGSFVVGVAAAID